MSYEYAAIFVAFAVSYAIRVLPLTLIRRPIRNRFVRSFLHYVPYVTLSVMTFPAILGASDSVAAGAAALAAGVALSFAGAGLFPVAVACCVVAFVVERFFR